MSERNWRFETLQIHAGQEQADPATGARAVPIYQTTSYVFENASQAAGRFELKESGYMYTRLSNPTTDVFEQRVAALEGGAGALATASGAAAITYAVQNIAGVGDHVVSSSALYGGTYNLFAHTFRQFGIETTFVSPMAPEGFEKAIRSNTKAIYVESLGNPHADIVDIEALAKLAHRHGIPLLVDNTFATPYLLRPIEYGADIVIHSATKFLGGHGTSLGGVVVDSGRFNWKASGRFPGLTDPDDSYHGLRFSEAGGAIAYLLKMRATLLRDTGAVLSPFNAFLLLQGLETLSLRVERHVENTMKVLEFLSGHPAVEKIHHPAQQDSPYHDLYERYYPQGAGSIFSVEIKGGAPKAQAFVERLKLFYMLANVADVKSLVIHPASTTHSQMGEEELLACGITQGTVRLSIGTEHAVDILDDLRQALDGIL